MHRFTHNKVRTYSHTNTQYNQKINSQNITNLQVSGMNQSEIYDLEPSQVSRPERRRLADIDRETGVRNAGPAVLAAHIDRGRAGEGSPSLIALSQWI